MPYLPRSRSEPIIAVWGFASHVVVARCCQGLTIESRFKDSMDVLQY